MSSKLWRWVLGLTYIVAVAAIWIAASFVVQSVVDEGVSPFLITYICNSLFIIYIPIIEISRYLEDKAISLCFWRRKEDRNLQRLAYSEEAILLGDNDPCDRSIDSNLPVSIQGSEIEPDTREIDSDLPPKHYQLANTLSSTAQLCKGSTELVDSKGRWTRLRVAKVSLVVCPFWFLAQLTFNLSLKYTSVTSNTILSTASSLFTFLFSLAFLSEKFTWVKLASVLLCMAGTIVVSLGDSSSSSSLNVTSSRPVLGDFLALLSSCLYAVYITLIRKKLPDEDDDDKSGKVSMAQFLGYLGFFNFIIFLPVALILNFTKLEPFYTLTWNQFGLVVGKGLLDNVLSDYLWAKAVLLTTTTVATAGLTIQVPLAAVVDTIVGNAPSLSDWIGAAVVIFGLAGINIPSDGFGGSKPTEQPTSVELEDNEDGRVAAIAGGTDGIS